MHVAIHLRLVVAVLMASLGSADASAYQKAAEAKAKITITAPPILTIADASANEGEDIVFAIKVSKAVSGGFTVTPSYSGSSATKGVDYTENTKAIQFTGTLNETKTFEVATIEDTEDEVNETFTVSLTTSSDRIVDSDTANGTIIDDDEPPNTPTAPDAPILTLTVPSHPQGRTQLDLSWSAPSNDGGSAITGYRLEWVDALGDKNIPPPSPTWKALAILGAKARSYSHTGLRIATSRNCYQVRAINSAGAGVPSNHACNITRGLIPPGVPTDLVVTAKSQIRIDLSWNAPDRDGGAPIQSYRIEMSPNGNTDWEDLESNTGSTGTSYSHTGLTLNTKRCYRVSATNSIGTGSSSPAECATTHSSTASMPGAPTLTAIASGQSQINLSWNEPSTGGATITGYRIEVSFDGRSNFTELVGRQTETTYSHTGLSANTTRHYRVRATNSVGDGPWSGVVKATTDSATPELSVDIACNGTVEVTEDDSDYFCIRLNNQPSETITIAASPDNGSVNVTPITLTFTTSNYDDYQNITIAHVTGTTLQSGQVDLASAGWAITPKNYQEYTISTTPSVPDTTVPGAPRSLTATENGQTMIDLSWTAPASNGGASITGYRIQSGSDRRDASFSNLVARQTSRTYSHTGLSAGTQYCYRVDAENSEGFGNWSNIACATTESDAVNLTATPSSITMPTGGASRAITVSIDKVPADPVTVRATTSVAGVTISGNVVLQSGALRKTFTVTSGNSTGSGTIQVRRVSGGAVSGAPNVSLRVYARPSIVVEPNRLSVYKPTSGTATGEFRIKLSEEPRVTQTIAISQPSDISRAPSSLTFTPSNYGTSQPVTVTVTPSTPVKSYAFNVTGTGDINSKPTVTVDVRDRSVLSVSPSKIVLAQGESKEVDIILTPPNKHETVSVDAGIPRTASGVTVTPDPLSFPLQPSGTEHTRKVTISASAIATIASVGSEHQIRFSATGNGVTNTEVLRVQVNYTKPQLCIGQQTPSTCAKEQSLSIRQDQTLAISNRPNSLTVNKLEGAGPQVTFRQSEGTADWFCVSGFSACTHSAWNSTSGGGGASEPSIKFNNNNIPPGKYTVTARASFVSGADSVKYHITIRPAPPSRLEFVPRSIDLTMVKGQKAPFVLGLNKPPSASITTKRRGSGGAQSDAPSLSSYALSFPPTDSYDAGCKCYGPKTVTVTVPDNAKLGVYYYPLHAPRPGAPDSLQITISVFVIANTASGGRIDIEGNPSQIEIMAGKSKTLRVKLTKRPVHGAGDAVVSTSELTDAYINGPDPPTLTFRRDNSHANAWNKWKPITISTDANTARTGTHTLTLTANGGGYVNVTKVVTIKTLPPACTGQVVQSSIALKLGGWRKPDSGKQGSVTVDAVSGNAVAENMITNGDGATAGLASISPTNCSSCTLTMAPPKNSVLTIKNTTNSVPFTPYWAKEIGGSYSLISGSSETFTGPSGGGKWATQQVQFGGKAINITNATQVGDYSGTINLTMTCQSL